MKLTTEVHMVPNLGTCGAVSPLLRIPSWLDALLSMGMLTFIIDIARKVT